MGNPYFFFSSIYQFFCTVRLFSFFRSGARPLALTWSHDFFRLFFPFFCFFGGEPQKNKKKEKIDGYPIELLAIQSESPAKNHVVRKKFFSYACLQGKALKKSLTDLYSHGPTHKLHKWICSSGLATINKNREKTRGVYFSTKNTPPFNFSLCIHEQIAACLFFLGLYPVGEHMKKNFFSYARRQSKALKKNIIESAIYKLRLFSFWDSLPVFVMES
nr:hypothetical protein [Trentepohlia sp. YN1317]